MAPRVNITSVEAIDQFRSSLIVYVAKARATLEEVSAEVVRQRNWVCGPQRTHWENVAKNRARQLEEAQAALFSAKMSNLREASAAEQMAVTKARRGMEEVELKLRTLRRWDRDFDNHVGPPTRQLEKLHNVLADDLEKAVLYLTQTIGTLNAYADLKVPALEAVLPGERKGPDDAASAAESLPGNSMSVRNDGNRLAMLTKELILKWRETREYWKDAKSDEFERNYMLELQSSVDTTATVIEQLDRILSKIKKDCE